MKLGADIFAIELAGEVHELRPTLRASLRLERRYGLHGLLVAVQAFDFTAIADMLNEAGVAPSLLQRDVSVNGLRSVIDRLTEPLLRFALAIAGIDPASARAPTDAPGERISPEAYFTRLFEIATGWLGWSAMDAWNATPTEILAAKAGRTDLIADMLKAVFGSQETGQPTGTAYTPERIAEIDTLDHDPAFDRKALAALKERLKR